jgi:hypothetical protein
LKAHFFMGGSNGWSDEIGLDCPDDYISLPLKTKAMLTWFLEAGPSHMFLCDNDTFISSSRFANINYRDFDYAGTFSLWPQGSQVGKTFRYNDGRNNIHENCYSWASGGYGYFVSKKAAEIIIETEPCSWAEDLSVGQALGPHIVSGFIKAHDFTPYPGVVTWHFQKNVKPFETSDIYNAFAAGQPSGPEWAPR